MNNRFEVVKEERVTLNYFTVDIFVLRDKQTGVMYVAKHTGGITPLLDKDGKPITTFKVSI